MQWVAPSERDNGHETLENRLWAAADQLRANSGLTSAQYSQPVLGLIFLRFAELRFMARRAVLGAQATLGRRGSRLDEADVYHTEGVLYLKPTARFDHLLRLPEGQDVGKAVNDAMRDIEQHNPQLAGVLPKTYQLFNSTLLKELLKTVSEIPQAIEGDAFGKIYEYFLGEFARTEGSRGGEFYTPTSIVRLLVEVLEPFHGRILDPACGSGGMFVQSARFVAAHRKNPAAELAVHGQEKAVFVAFTGTPLIAAEERTRDVFGDYVSIYDFQQSVEDHATVRLFYENRTPELRLENPDLNDDIYALIEAAGLDEDQGARLQRELGRQYHLLTRDDRLNTVAKDIVQHFLRRGFRGKAMVVSIDKATALRMYDKVRTEWQAEQRRLQDELKQLTAYGTSPDPDRTQELNDRLETLTTTDMAVIVSPGQNEVEQMKGIGLDIVPHRKRMNEEALDERFKDAKDPLRLVFLCAMWLTGFDVPSCSTIYLDKPMRNHTLMQTIARANRVFPGKYCGLIVDYANVFTSLEKALAIYAKGHADATPVRDKKQLVQELRAAMDAATAFCRAHGTNLDDIEGLPASGLERLNRIADAVDRLISPDAVRKEFLSHARWVVTLYQAVKPDPAVVGLALRVATLKCIADTIQSRTSSGPVNISSVMGEINDLLDASIAADGFKIRDAPDASRARETPDAPYADSRATVDLSALDFDALAARFKTPNARMWNSNSSNRRCVLNWRSSFA